MAENGVEGDADDVEERGESACDEEGGGGDEGERALCLCYRNVDVAASDCGVIDS